MFEIFFTITLSIFPSTLLCCLVSQREWTLNSGDYYVFQIDVKKSDDSLTALELAKQAIEYARELEMIV